MKDRLSAREAASLLGVKLPTLYAYVSRGQIESVPGQGRAKLYRRSDVERLLRRRQVRSDPVAEGALSWGPPVLDSSITEVLPAGPVYRGHAAVELAEQGVSFEAVAELLWTGKLPTKPRWKADSLGAPAARLATLVPQSAPPLTRLATLVPILAARDVGRFDRAPRAVLPRARALIRRLAIGQALGRPSRVLERAARSSTVAQVVSVALGARGGKAAAEAIDQALVLWADHELNVSSFAARVAASAHSDLYSCVSAGLAALSGPRHGAACDQIEALIREAKGPADAARVLHERTRRGEAIPGFGHPFYPDGDPRAKPLLARAKELAPRSTRVQTTLAVIDAVASASGLAPTVDAALVALAAALNLDEGAAPGIIAVGRSAGWVAHILEQYEAGFLIRPRARYRPGT